MFYELMKANGFDIRSDTNSIWQRHQEFDIIVEYKILIDDTTHIVYGDNITSDVYQAKEQACMQYCIENGVKLEWLCQDVDGDYMKRILDNEWVDLGATFSPATPLEAWLEYHLPRIMPNSRKLIFAILGHDIKIIAT